MKMHNILANKRYRVGYFLELELSLKITSDESICTWCISDRLVSSTSPWNGFVRATCRRRHRVNIGKAFAWILGNSRGWQRIAFLTPEERKCRVKIRDKDAWRHTARPHVRRFFVERLCKYYRRRKLNSTQTESFRVWARQNRFHSWIGYFAKRPRW